MYQFNGIKIHLCTTLVDIIFFWGNYENQFKTTILLENEDNQLGTGSIPASRQILSIFRSFTILYNKYLTKNIVHTSVFQESFKILL